MTKVAIVTNWFGSELKGGAEQQAWQIAQRLAAGGVHVEVLTTCSRSFHHSWSRNHHRPGKSIEHGLAVHRFPVDSRDKKAFDSVVGRMLQMDPGELVNWRSPISESDQKVYLEHNISSQALLNFLSGNLEYFDHFLFLPYLFPVVLEGVQITGTKALLQPCLHDEVYAYLPAVRHAFNRCGRILLNSRGEELLVRKIMGEWISEKCVVVGEGVEVDEHRSGGTPHIDGPYLLYLGKKCSEKNTDLLVAAFDRFARHSASNLRLVLAGVGEMPLASGTDRIVDVGLVDEPTKANLLAHCIAVVNLSVNESFSRLVFESWWAGKPVIVHRRCLATYTALRDANDAGWAVDGLREAEQLFHQLVQTSCEEFAARGERGRRFAANLASWDSVVERYLQCFSETSPTSKPQRAAMIVCSRHPGRLRRVAVYIDYLERIGCSTVVVAPFLIRDKVLSRYQRDEHSLREPYDYYFWFHGSPWESMRQLVDRAAGKKVLFHEGEKACGEAFDLVYDETELVPVEWEAYTQCSYGLDFNLFRIHNTAATNIAITCHRLDANLLDFVANLQKVCDEIRLGSLRLMVFANSPEHESFDGKYNIAVFETAGHVSFELLDSYLFACDAVLLFETGADWRALLIAQRSQLPVIEIGDASAHDGGLHYGSHQVRQIAQSLAAVTQSRSIRQKSVGLFQQTNWISQFRSCVSRHMSQVLESTNQEATS